MSQAAFKEIAKKDHENEDRWKVDVRMRVEEVSSLYLLFLLIGFYTSLKHLKILENHPQLGY